jgi:hypothetical protein
MSQESHTSSQPSPPEEDRQAGVSFGDEVKSLLGGMGWGIRWLAVSLAWGVCLFMMLALIGYAIWGGPIENPARHYGLIVVFGLMTGILSVLWRRIR